MVTTRHNGKLSHKDVWPGLPWTSKDILRIQDECRQRAIDSGITEEPRLTLVAAREYEKYMQQFPKYGERQKIFEKIYPHIPKKQSVFTEEELDYLLFKLNGSNDPIGQALYERFEEMK